MLGFRNTQEKLEKSHLYSKLDLHLTLKEKGFIPSWVKSSSFDFGFQSMFLIREQSDSNIGVAQAISVACFQIPTLQQTDYILTNWNERKNFQGFFLSATWIFWCKLRFPGLAIAIYFTNYFLGLLRPLASHAFKFRPCNRRITF